MKKRIVGALLCAAMLFGMIPVFAFQAYAVDTLEVHYNGNPQSSVTLPVGEAIELTADFNETDASFQWQILVPNADWVDISGETEASLRVSYAMIANLLDEDTAQIRCEAEADGETVTSEPVEVTVSDESSYEVAAASDSTDVSVASAGQTLRSAQVDRSAVMSVSAAGSDSAVPLAEGDTPELTNYSVVINYVFENNVSVAEPYTATLAAGSNFSATVNHPTVQGYLPYVGNDTETSTSIELNITNIQADMTYTVTYKPTNVNYTVIHYQQNVDNDQYTIKETEKKQGLTDSTVPEVGKTYEGFYALLYEKPAIAADGSTVVEVYYDRYYYLMNFDLDGGYGVEPIYARYGAPVSVGTPTKAGYSFSSWNPEVPATVPANGGTYKALWTAGDSAKVSVVFWGENANDEEYSYLTTGVVYAKPGTEYTFTDGQTQFLICGKEEHTHGTDCSLTCGKEEHTTHTDACLGSCTHTSHDLKCYQTRNNYTLKEATPDQTLTATQDGVYTYTTGSGRDTQTHYYLLLDGTWYCYYRNSNGNKSDTQSISLDCDHTHTDACYSCEVHTHTAACYSCGMEAHTHTNSCYQTGSGLDSDLWTFVRSETVTVAADGSSVINVYFDRTEFTLTFKKNSNTVKTITEKWGADIHSEFPIKDTGGTIQWLVPNGCESMESGTRFASLDSMPAENINFTYYTSDDTVTLHYYVEALPGETVDYTHDGKNFKSYKDIDIQDGVYLTYTEEFHDIIGFKQWWSDPEFNKHEQGGRTDYVYDDCVLCYTRNTFDIEYYNPTSQIKVDENIPYQMPLADYYWEPTSAQAPAQYEPGSVKFDGWYLNPECTGEEFDFTTQTMPVGPNNVDGETALSLYAKWVPVTHTVEFYLDADALAADTKIGDSHPDLTVPHGSKVETVPAEPDNGDYTFVGWFYMEDGVEKAFDFANMPVNKDMKVYAKWSSNVLKEYNVYYKIQGTDTQIADPTTGSALAGITKTFDAKGGTDLYADYQEGYFPVTKSHSMTIDIKDDTKNTFTFWYVQKEAVPYTVKYLNAETGEPVATEKVVSDNHKAVVTETFVPVTGYMPDAYQKRLVVDGTDGAVNEIIFYYTEDTEHAYYKITHYTQNTDGATWTEYASSQIVGDIGTTYTADPLSIDGFTYDPTVEGTVTSGVLTANGLELKLYYIRNSYPYEVRYLEQGTGTQLAAPKTGSGKYGQVISESAINIDGYTAVDPTSQTLTIKIEQDETAQLNIITFYYTEQEVTINYVAVGNGSVSPESETLKVKSGTAQGSTATPGENYKFVGWYSDAACTNLLRTDAKFVPEKVDGKNVAATYYAKFELDVADLTITKSGAQDIDENQTFIFRVTGPNNFSMDVVIKGNGSVTIKNLPIGEYTVKELTDWSWRYTPDDVEQSIILNAGTNTVEFKNTRSNPSWLSSDAFVRNWWGKFIKSIT